MDTSQLRSDVAGWEPALRASSYWASLSLVVTYCIGFLIVSIHQGLFGIVRFDLLRPRILSAGVAFVVLVSLCAAIAIRIRREGDGKMSVQKLVFWVIAARGVGTTLSGWLQLPYNAPFTRLSVIPLVGGTVLLGLRLLIPHRWLRESFRLVGLGALLLGLGADLWSMDPALKFFVGWLVLAGLVALRTLRLAEDPTLRETLSYPTYELQLVILPLLVVGTYASLVYGNLPVAVGGGHPVPMRFYLEQAIPGVIDSALDVELIDETSDGFYVLRSKDRKPAAFIPRSAVRLAEFPNATALSK